MVDDLNGIKYNNPRNSFFNLKDGSEYPCGNNDPATSNTGSVKCYIFNGDNNQMGIPTSITMYHILYDNLKIKARILLHNPEDELKWMSVRVKAFAGTSSTKSPFGPSPVGSWNFENFFQTKIGALNTIPNANICAYPQKGYWR